MSSAIHLKHEAAIMVATHKEWYSTDIAEHCLRLLSGKWGIWYLSHWHAASLAVVLTAHFLELGGRLRDLPESYPRQGVDTNHQEDYTIGPIR